MLVEAQDDVDRDLEEASGAQFDCKGKSRVYKSTQDVEHVKGPARLAFDLAFMGSFTLIMMAGP